MTPPNKRPTHRPAVAIDCEMGTAFDGDTELIRLTLIDYFSGETLIDSLVYPDIPMKHFNTRWSGITRGDMEASRRKRLCIHGRNAARRAVFRFVGRSTIVVGHGAQSDLSALRWIHHRVVDSFIVESVRRKHNMQPEEMSGSEEDGGKKAETGEIIANQKHRQKGSGSMSLKTLAMERLGRAIQVGKNGHDSMEDAIAARDLIHSYIIGPSGADDLASVFEAAKIA